MLELGRIYSYSRVKGKKALYVSSNQLLLIMKMGLGLVKYWFSFDGLREVCCEFMKYMAPAS